MKFLYRKKIIEALLPKKKEGLTEGAILTALGTAKQDNISINNEYFPSAIIN